MSRAYFEEVGKVIDRLRAQCLGLDQPLTAKTAQILFALASQPEFPAKELPAAQRWMEAAAQYILTHCDPEEQTFASLVRFAKESPDILPILAPGAPNRPKSLTQARLELAVVAVLEANGLLDDAKDQLRQMESFCA